jgi:hypothetical protein
MRGSLKRWLVLLVLIFDLVQLKGQTDDPFIRVLREKLASYTRTVPYEDMYLHSDRDTYIAGEYLWFRAYLFDRQRLSLSSESSYAYIELLDPANQPVSQTRVKLEKGSGCGGLRLPDTLAAGEYTLRAYTNWMKNFLPEGCFMKRVTIYNPFNEAIFKKPEPAGIPDKSDKFVFFFPEGGRLLNGFVNRVGVKVFCNGNMSPGFKGHLSDGTNDSIITVVIDSTGTGSFEFFAKKGLAWNLTSDDKKYRFPLPPISQTGYSLNIRQETDNNMKLTINSEGSDDPGSNYCYVVILSGGKIIYDQRVILTSKSTGLVIPENKLSQGINQITIFDGNSDPACNRLFYKPDEPGEGLKIQVPAESGKREKVALEIIPDSVGFSNMEFSNLSLSVSAIAPAGRGMDIDDYLVTGDEYLPCIPEITRQISFSEMSLKAIDDYLLSLRGNWIRWEDILTGKLPDLKYPAEKGKQFLSGYYTGRSKTEDNAGKLLFLSRPGKIPLFKYAETDKDNRFEFSISDKESSDDIIIQPAVADKNFSIVIESPFSRRFPANRYFVDSSRNKIPMPVSDMSVNYQVEKIYGITNLGDTIKPSLSLPGPVRFYGKPDQELIMSDYISLPVMQEVFFELVPGVQVKMKKQKYGLFIQDAVTRYYYDTPPGLLVDGVIIDDPSLVLNLDPELVEKIDIVKSGYIVGNLIFSGIISVFTKAGDFSNIALPENSIRIRKNVYDLPVRFKSPEYTTGNSGNDRIPDFRNTLYWNPELRPGNGGKTIVEIMTSDYGADYEINLQGVFRGKPISVRKTLIVR